MMIVMILIMLVIKTAAVTDITSGAETDLAKQTRPLCHHLEFGDTEIPFNIPNDTQCLEVVQTQIPRISQGAFTRLQHLRKLIISKNERLENITAFAFAGHLRLTRIIISENVALTSIGAFAFSDLPELHEISITKSKHLRHIHEDAFRNIVKLQSMTISSTGLTMFPNLSKIHSAADDFEFRLHENNHIKEVPANAFRGLCTQTINRIIISKNERLENITAFAFAGHLRLTRIIISENVALTSIGAFAFSDLPELHEISITKSKHLRHIHEDAFRNIVKLRHLTISSTGLTMFPNLSKIHSAADDFVFRLQENNHIKEVPANAFRGLCTQTIIRIELTRNGIEEVASDAFNGTKMQRLYLKGNKQLTHINPNAFVGSSELGLLDISKTALSSLPEKYILSGLKKLIAESAFNLKKLPPPHRFTKLRVANLTYSSHCCAFERLKRNGTKLDPICLNPEAQNNIHLYKDLCSNSSPAAQLITCSPTHDDFNPCGDIMNAVPLRVLIWIISILALLGNAAVLLVLLGSRSKLTTPRFLMCHLAFSDLCMGIYLVVIATVDILTRGQYYNDALDWQTGLGCSAAGFFTVFASELSVFTLTAITLERWHTITHALRLDRKLRMRHACIVMTGGWIFSSIAALLPTVGVSSYGKVSICLPMDVESLESQVYVVSLLLLNILAFVCVCGCYLSIYLTVRIPSSAPAHADTRVAQRMAILIFTDFVCMAPISFFAISAALKLPLISVSGAKLLLVLFYPINSCANPFLYAFFTRTFRQDFFLLTARFGLFKTQAQIYRTESSSC